MAAIRSDAAHREPGEDGTDDCRNNRDAANGKGEDRRHREDGAEGLPDVARHEEREERGESRHENGEFHCHEKAEENRVHAVPPEKWIDRGRHR